METTWQNKNYSNDEVQDILIFLKNSYIVIKHNYENKENKSKEDEKIITQITDDLKATIRLIKHTKLYT